LFHLVLSPSLFICLYSFFLNGGLKVSLSLRTIKNESLVR
jgi:hypothetical protein